MELYTIKSANVKMVKYIDSILTPNNLDEHIQID